MHNKPIIDEIKDILPGFLVSLTIGMVSNVIANFIPSLGSATIAILFGIIVGNLFLSHDIFQRGYKFSESNLLAYSIVLLGGTLSLSSLMEIKLTGIIYIITQMAITIMVCMFVGKRLQFSSDFIYLMASGNSVCGSSAIAATSSAINASDNDKGITITITNVMGIFLMFLLPIISRLLYNNELLKTSALIGGVIQSVGQVIASGLMINEQVKEFAMIFKIFRVILLILVVFLFGHLKNKSNKEIIQDEESNIKSGNVTVPWYVIGFFIACILFSLKIITPNVSAIMKKLSSSLEIVALAGIGLRVNIRELVRQGKRVLIYGTAVAICQVASAIILILILFR
ncbi:YeiH family protein [Clostridium sp. HCP1S3_B4]|uniref:YeiH family protein n=1 Tax=unclassified Clostridium TaxID=2614128 RepID=UPI002A7D3B19|nr:putative sulfate exporter family transporter [Clostridiales bacterium]MDY2729103.1 putative sulfate exporter family transporter [Clostridium sp.]